MKNIPSVTLTVSRAGPTNVNYVYREYTSGITVMSSLPSQAERLTRITRCWRELESRGSDLLLMGVLNLDWRRWQASDYTLSCLVDIVKHFQADTGMCQTVKDPTHFTKNGSFVLWTIIDHN